MAVNVWSAAGAGNWSAGGNWSLGHAPQAGEDVLFDNTSVADCTNDVAAGAYLGSFTIADTYTGTFDLNSKTMRCTGNVYLGTGCTLTGHGTAQFELKPTLASTLTTNGNSMPFFYSGGGANMSLVDDCTVIGIGNVTYNSGGLDLNGQTLTCASFSNRTANSVLNGDINCSGASVTLDNSDITGTLTMLSTASLALLSSLSIARLILSAGETYTIVAAPSVLTIGSYTAGDWDGATLQGSAGTDWNMSAPAGMVVSNMAVADSNNSGAAIDASDGTNTDNGDNTGWNFVAPAPPATASTPKQSKCSIGIGIGI